MSDRKLHTKTVYILAWVILVCAGILIKTGITDDVWKLVYSGIYGSSSGETGESIYSPGAAEPDVYCYMDYWESQVREVCEEGRTYQTEDADSEGEASCRRRLQRLLRLPALRPQKLRRDPLMPGLCRPWRI